MNVPIYSGICTAWVALIILVGSYSFLACNNEVGQKDKPTAAAKEPMSAPDGKYDSSQTPYICAMRSLQAVEKENLAALIAYVHPTKGLTVTHVAESIQNHEHAFSLEELHREVLKPTTYTILKGYEEEDVQQSTLISLLNDYAKSSSFQNDNLAGRLFSNSKDVRRNYIGNGSYSLYPPLANNQTTISYHFSDSINEMGWEDIVFRTETFKGKDYLVEILRAFWTP